jgi:hypothetical protein
MRKHGLKILGLALMAALSLMALSVTAAQAAENLEWGDKPGSGEPGEFLVGGTLSPAAGLPGIQAVGANLVAGTSSRLLIPKRAAEIVCKKFTLSNATIANEYEDWLLPGMKVGGHGKGDVLFEECEVFKINETTGALEGELKSCTENLNVATSPAGKHHVTVTGALLLIRKHEGTTYLVIEPGINSKADDEAVAALTKAFTTIKEGGTCALPEKAEIFGAFAAKVPATDAIKPKVAVDTFSAAGKAEQTLLGTKLKYGANEAFIQGEVETELVGKNVAWGSM